MSADGQISDLPAAARRWVESKLGSPVVSARPLTGDWTSTMLAVTTDDGAEAVVRIMTKEPWLAFCDRAPGTRICGPAATCDLADPRTPKHRR